MINKIKKWLGIHIHDWSKWEIVYDAIARSNYGTVKTQLVQARRCKVCGKVEQKIDKKTK